MLEASVLLKIKIHRGGLKIWLISRMKCTKKEEFQIFQMREGAVGITKDYETQQREVEGAKQWLTKVKCGKRGKYWRAAQQQQTKKRNRVQNGHNTDRIHAGDKTGLT